MAMNAPAHTCISLALLGTVLLLPGCKKPEREDMQRPRIDILATVPPFSTATICEETSTRTMRVNVGSTIGLDLLFTDDQGLGSAKFDLHSNFDCHGHKSGGGDQQVNWAFLEVVELDGQEQQVTRQFTAPVNARPGNHHFTIQCLDATGREAVPIHIDVLVVDPSDTIPPVIDLQQPGEGHIQPRSVPIQIEGTVTDENDLGTGGIEITITTPNGIQLSVVRIDHAYDVGQVVHFSQSHTMPGFVPNGTCVLKVKAFDGRNNSTVLERAFELTD